MTTFAKTSSSSSLLLLLLLAVSSSSSPPLVNALTVSLTSMPPFSKTASFSIRRRLQHSQRQHHDEQQQHRHSQSQRRQRQQQQQQHSVVSSQRLASRRSHDDNDAEPSSSPSSSPLSSWMQQAQQLVATVSFATVLSTAVFLSGSSSMAAWAENELSAKYGGAGFDSSLVDQTCLVDHCSLQAKACLADDPSCRKGLTCTAKCMGDNACITGCMARYGNSNLDHLLQCTIEDHECIKVAILDGGADAYGQEPPAPGPTLRNFNYKSLEGSWYKVVGYNPNYDCYACQRNTFTLPNSNSNSNNNNGGGPVATTTTTNVNLGHHHQASNNINNQHLLLMDVEFSMPHLMPDGSPPPPASVRESIQLTPDETILFGSQSIGLNDYNTHETMVFDTPSNNKDNNNNNNKDNNKLVLRNKGTNQDVSYARTAHSEGEMFGLKFWENWYILGENDPGTPEFKFIYYNGKTRQNTYEGAFVYSRTRELSPSNLEKVYRIAQDAGMNPQQFCKIRNGCFTEDADGNSGSGSGTSSSGIMMADPFRGILASTKVSQLLGVEPVKAEGMMRKAVPTARILTPPESQQQQVDRPWWYEVGDYLENPHRHFQAMDQLRVPMEWPESVVTAATSTQTSSSSSSSSSTTMARK